MIAPGRIFSIREASVFGVESRRELGIVAVCSAFARVAAHMSEARVLRRN